MRVKNFGAVLASLVFACSLFLSGPALAERGARGGGGEKMLQRLTTELQLSESQVAQIKSIYEAHKPRMQQLRGEMKSTFTPEQKEAMKEMRKSNKGERPSKEERQAKLAQIGISQGQMDQMKSLRRQMKTERQAIQSEVSNVLTTDQRAKLEQMKSEWKSKRGKRGNRGPK